ncbi:hypothetical protein Bbelb_332950 [Branchiostoma belcheri]|nr:hypothetical protein Bbelb_332950 [Branchiostoma belcheri]
MTINMKRLLVLLLILLKEAGPTAACSSSCPSNCNCGGRGLSSVPQDLPTNMFELRLSGNEITTLNQSDFSRYSSLYRIILTFNQISVINSGAFYNLSRLVELYLPYNQLTILRSDMFVGLDSLQRVYLYHNNIHSVEAGTFNATPQLVDIQLQHNNISNIAAGAFVNLHRLHWLTLYQNRINILPPDFWSNLDIPPLSGLWLNSNQLETLPVMAYDILTSISFMDIDDNPWQCDCRMLPFKQRMTSSHPIDNQTTCAGPASPTNLTGSLLRDVNPDDLGCEETTTEIYSSPSTTSPVIHSTQNFHSPSSTTTASRTTNFHSEPSPTAPSTTNFHSEPSPTAPSTTNFHSEPSPTAPSTTNFHSEPSPTAPSTTNFHSEPSPTAPSTTNFHSEPSPTAPSTTNFHSEPSQTSPSTTEFPSGVTEGGVASSPASFSLSAFLSGFLGGVLGSLLTATLFLAIFCIKMRVKTSPAPVPDPSGVSSNPNGAATGPTSGRHHTGQGTLPSPAAHSDDGESRPGTSGTVPPPRSLDKSYAVLRAPLPPIKTAGPRGDVRNGPEAAHGDAAADISEQVRHNNMKRFLILLLIILKEAGPTSAHSCDCYSSFCGCGSMGLTSVPQDLPTTITHLGLQSNNITTLNQSDFSRYSSLTDLLLHYNQISVINSGTFYSLSRLTRLYLEFNQLTSLRSDMFVGLDSLQHLHLQYNSISSITDDAFVHVPRLEYLYMGYNQMETLPPLAYGMLASIRYVDITNNPWQCDCRMYPFKQRMTGLSDFESQIQCAASVLEGKSLLHNVTQEDLICEGPLGAFFLSGSLGVVVGIFLTVIFSHVIWPQCINRKGKIRTEPDATPIPAPDTPQVTDIDCAQACPDVTETAGTGLS